MVSCIQRAMQLGLSARTTIRHLVFKITACKYNIATQNQVYSRYPIVTRALGLAAAFRSSVCASKGILHTTKPLLHVAYPFAHAKRALRPTGLKRATPTTNKNIISTVSILREIFGAYLDNLVPRVRCMVDKSTKLSALVTESIFKFWGNSAILMTFTLNDQICQYYGIRNCHKCF